MHLPDEVANYQARALDYISQMPDYPSQKFAGQGIVLCGGGETYFTCAWVCIQMLRKLGCTLPIEFWYLGSAEMNQEMIRLIEPLGVKCIDALEVWKEYPVKNLIGWELKAYAILHSQFEEVLYLDTDNVPVRDPAFLFESEGYQKTGSVFWPDRYLGRGHGLNWTKQEVWDICQVPFRNEPEFETGQIVLNKRRCWYPLLLTMHYNEHSDFYYAYFYGDKDTFRIAWHKLGVAFTLLPFANRSLHNDAVILQHDFEGEVLFQHRNGDKWSLSRNPMQIAGFKFEFDCLQLLQELRLRWPGMRRKLPDDFHAIEKKVYQELVDQKTFLSSPSNEDWVELSYEGFVVEPNKNIDKKWTVIRNGLDQVVLKFQFNTRYATSGFLWPKEHGAWKGMWMDMARTPIEIRPKLNAVDPVQLAFHQKLQEELINNFSPYPEGKYEGRGIIIVGGGNTYFPCAWVCINVLRKIHQCQLPIELWYLGKEEMPGVWEEKLSGLDVQCIDLYEVIGETQVKGYVAKPLSIIHSQFEEVLFIDADNVPIKDPAFLFEYEAYQELGAYFWPDYGRLASYQPIWSVCNVPYQNEPAFETGQMVINKRKSWEALQLTDFYNQHSDFYYQYLLGDKDTFHLAWRRLGQKYIMNSFDMSPINKTMRQFDYQGDLLFQHRNLDKWNLHGGNLKIQGFQFEEECISYLNELRE
ncbi:MAG: hypothetical protein KDC34_14995 [Saprospiraceae bacterium]|nr:hypothetical protein [Saprospiraceae bacterium]